MKLQTILFLAAAAFSSVALAQTEEYRISTTYEGNNANSLRSFNMTVELSDGEKWKTISRAYVVTGRNFALADIRQDSSVLTVLPFRELLKNPGFSKLYELALNVYMDRIEAPDQLRINAVENTTTNQVLLDRKTGVMTASLKAGEKDTDVIVTIAAADNSRMVLISKTLKPFAGNMVEMNTSMLKPGNYIVTVTTPTMKFSEAFLLY